MTGHRSAALLAAVTVAATVVLWLLADVTALTWLRVVIGIPFLLVLPGAAALLLVDPEARLGGLEWFTLATSASIAFTTLSAVALAASVGLSARAEVAVLGALTAALLASAWLRGADASRALRPGRRGTPSRFSLAAVGLLGCSALVLALMSPVLRGGASDQVVELWGLPDAAGNLRIGADNVDATPRRFHIAIKQGALTIAEQDIDLPAGGKRIFVVERAAIPLSNAPVVAQLTDPTSVVGSRQISVWADQ